MGKHVDKIEQNVDKAFASQTLRFMIDMVWGTIIIGFFGAGIILGRGTPLKGFDWAVYTIILIIGAMYIRSKQLAYNNEEKEFQ